MIDAAIGLPLAAFLSLQQAPLLEYGCQWASVRRIDPGLRVLDQAAAPGRFAPAAHAGDAIVCYRSSVVPGPDDWEVGVSGRILYIVERIDGADGRMAELDYAGGKFALTMLSGSYAKGEEARVGERMAAFETAARDGSR